MGYEVVSPRNSTLRAGTVTVAPPNAYAVSRELIARDIIIDYREGAGIRIAPHFYNSDEEVRTTMQTIADILEDGSWQQHAKDRDFVT
jgi:kynureninase